MMSDEVLYVMEFLLELRCSNRWKKKAGFFSCENWVAETGIWRSWSKRRYAYLPPLKKQLQGIAKPEV